MAKLYFRYGAMGSSKTANAIMVQYNYHERGQKALMLKPRLETRDGEKTVRSRSGLSAPCEYVEDLDTIDVSAYDCLIVDEAQFLTKSQVERLVRVVDAQRQRRAADPAGGRRLSSPVRPARRPADAPSVRRLRGLHGR